MRKRSYGVLLRVYTPKPEEVADRVERAIRHVRQVIEVSNEVPALERMVIVVPLDYDCGQTGHALRDRIFAEGLLAQVTVCEPHGHHSCEALNAGINAIGADTTHAIIISGKAMSYLIPSALRRIDQAFEKGAMVSGLAVDELRKVVLEGRVQNTFAAWDIDALHQVGGFNSENGVEEITPLVHLVRKFGLCIASIDTGAGTLDIHASETARARHHEVMTTKLERQKDEVMRVGSNFDEITAGIIPGYPCFI